MPDTDRMENVTVQLIATISVSKCYDTTKLVSLDLKETGCFNLTEAMTLMRAHADKVISRCGERIEQRMLDAQRQITMEEKP